MKTAVTKFTKAIARIRQGLKYANIVSIVIKHAGNCIDEIEKIGGSVQANTETPE